MGLNVGIKCKRLNGEKILTVGSGHIHLVGVCGVGMAGLAYLLSRHGFRVTGCDMALNPLAEWLSQNEITVSTPHDPKHIDDDVNWVIRSAAVPEDNKELLHAQEMDIPISKRGEVLPLLLAERKSIAVCGTHGKTTTASFLVQILRHAGIDPGWCIGGNNDSLSGVAGEGAGKLLVLEADESDATLALYKPDIAIVTNIEFDHMDHFENREAVKECFQQLLDNTDKKVIFCADDPVASELCSNKDGAVSYGFSDNSDLKGVNLCASETGQSFELVMRGENIGSVEMPFPGTHNAENLLAAIAVAFELDLSLNEINSSLKNLSLPLRRFEKIADFDDIVVISDYAHHPSEIAALIQTAAALNRSRIRAVFQPHRYTRTLALGGEFPSAFEGVDELILTPVYASSESPLIGGTTWDLYRHFREKPNVDQKVFVAASLEQAWNYVRQTSIPGDLFLVIGAGDVEKIAYWAADDIKKDGIFETLPAIFADLSGICPDSRFIANESLAGKTTLKVGGCADIWAEIGSISDLLKIRKYCADNNQSFNVMGGGSNILVSDLGVRGVTARLKGQDFNTVSEKNGTIVVDAGTALPALLTWTMEHGWSGLEFLEGIPGTVGGAVRMNAGAYEESIGKFINWIKISRDDGEIHTIYRKDLNFGYRYCEQLKKNILIKVGLTLECMDAGAIWSRRREISECRAWMKGLRSAGSIFKNPPNDYAGRLIDSLGLKGMSVGGAMISEKHANIIVTTDVATASDVFSLIELVKSEVKADTGVVLEEEIIKI